MDQEASRTITDPPAELFRISIVPDPPRGFTQAVLYFESETDALRWLADPHPKVLSIHRLGESPGTFHGKVWRQRQYQPPTSLGTLAPVRGQASKLGR